MKKFLQKKIKNEKGLTLVELLAVIVILGASSSETRWGDAKNILSSLSTRRSV